MPLIKTSIQLSDNHIAALSSLFPGISQSEAIRILINRASFYDYLHSTSMPALVDQNLSILDHSLQGFGYNDHEMISRILHKLVDDASIPIPNSPFERIAILDLVCRRRAEMGMVTIDIDDSDMVK